MFEESQNDNISSHSIDNMNYRHNKNLEIILEEKNSSNNNQNNIEEIENKTQTNFNKIANPLLDIEQPKRYNSCEKRKKNKILQKKLQEILDYRAKFKSIEAEENLEEERLKNEESEKKQKVESKVNRNLKLLNLIKEKMNQNKEIKNDNDNKEKKEINDDENDIEKKENIIENNDKINENKDENSINKNEDKKDSDEKEKKLIQIFDKKQINIEKEKNKNLSNNYSNNKQEKENEQEKEQNDTISKEKEKENYNSNNYQKRKIPHPNTGSVSYPTFMKKGSGNFQISTPKTKQQNMKNISKSSSNEKKEEDKDKNVNSNNNSKDNKYSDIPSGQKNKLTIKINPKNISFTPDNSNKNSNKKENNSENKKVSSSNKKEEKSISNNNTNNQIKKGAMKILELLKAQKLEENDNNNKIETNEEKKEVEQMIPNENKNKINSSLFNQSKEETKKTKKVENQIEDDIIDTVSLPKKKFREEDEEENEYTKKNYNRTQQVFRKSNKKIKPNNNINENDFNINNNNNNSSRIKTNYYNNINNNINNFFNIGETTNYGERKTIEYINNANLLRNKYNKKIKNFTSNNQFINEENDYDNDNDIFRVGNNSQINYMQQKNSMIDNNNLNIKNLDKSYDMFRAKNTPLPKRVINKNILSNNINNPKKINTHSPRELTKYRPYEKNTANNFQRNGRIYNKINYKRNTPAYVKKSPGKINIKKTREYRSLGKLDTDNKNQNRSKQNKSNNYNITNKKNIIGNNDGMEISAIYGLNSSIDSSTSNRTNNKNIKSIETKKENTMVFNIEDLLVLEEKLNNITFSLESNKNIDSQCFNFWNYYFNCSLYKILEKIFPNEEDANIIRLSINYQLMSIMVCYDFAFCNNIEDEDLNLSLIELIYFNHNNLMIICEYILTKITPENTDNIWVLKLQEIVKNSKFSQSKEPYNNINNTSVPIQKILNNTNKIIKKIKSILLNYQSDSTSLLKNYILNLPRKTYSEINNFFRSQILRIDNYEGSLVPPSFFKKNQDFAPLPAPYLQFPSSKPYTLILDLDETLVSFQIKSKKEGTLRARPFLFAFLEEMGHYYELIVWTSATEAYANSLIDAIEYDKQYFDYILFREHAIIIGDEFVKDLNRVGRGLDRIIIVDDMPQNFRLQKQNGITIKPFYGDDYNDTALYDLLPILKRIAEEGNDVRIELAKYREEIVRKITSNISLKDI